MYETLCIKGKMYQSKLRASKRRGKQREKVFVEKTEGQIYAIVQDMLGNGRLNAICEDDKLRVCRIRGSMRKFAGKVIIERGDLILVSVRDFEPDKADVIHKYSAEDVQSIIRSKELSDKFMKKLTLRDECMYGKTGAGDDCVVFLEDEKETQEAASAVEEGTDEDEEGSDIDIDAI